MQCAAADARYPDYLAALVGANLARGSRYEVLTNGDQILPGHAEGDKRRQTRISLRDLHLRHRHRRRAVHRGVGEGRKARRAACR